MQAERRAKIEAYEEQFPALKSLSVAEGKPIAWREAEVFEVKRLNTDFLQRVPVRVEGVNQHASMRWDKHEDILFVDASGIEIERVACRFEQRDHEYPDILKSVRGNGESPGDALMAMSPASLAKVVLVVSLKYESGALTGRCLNMTVYRQPKDFTVQLWVEKMRSDARAALARQLEEVETLTE